MTPSTVESIYRGAAFELERLVQTHLFVICPNNSGSTFLKNVLATSQHTWNLHREGQHVFGFAGPATRDTPVPLFWASDPTWLEFLADPEAYDWEATRRAWYFQAYSQDPEASVFVTKAPPFLLHVGALARHFRNARFCFMVRNPYATAEGILRRKRRFGIDSDAEILRLAAHHLVNCLRIQQQNLESFGHLGIFFSYEAMCEAPETVEKMMRVSIPALADVNLRQRVPVKGIYDEPLQNMNARQMGALTTDHLRALNEVFFPEKGLLESFGYSLEG